MIRDYEVRQILDRAAQIIHEYDSNPSTWTSWVTYLLERLENQSMDVDPANRERFKEMLATLQDAIYNRRQTSGW